MKLAFKIVWEIISIPLDAICCLLMLGFMPILLPLIIVGVISSGFAPSFVAGFFVSRKFAALKAKTASAFIWLVAFGLLFFCDQYIARVIFSANLNFVQANCAAAVGAVLFRRYIWEQLIGKVRRTMPREEPVA